MPACDAGAVQAATANGFGGCALSLGFPDPRAVLEVILKDFGS